MTDSAVNSSQSRSGGDCVNEERTQATTAPRNQARSLSGSRIGLFAVIGLAGSLLLAGGMQPWVKESGFWAWQLSVALYATLSLFPSLRPSLSWAPSNWAHAIGFVALVVVPVLTAVTEAEGALLPIQPTADHMNRAVTVTVLGYVALCMGKLVGARGAPRPDPRNTARTAQSEHRSALGFALLTVGIGAGFARWLGASSRALEQSSGLMEALLAFAAPLALTGGAILCWNHIHKSLALGISYLALGMAPLLTYNLSRGAWMFPAIVFTVSLLCAIRSPAGRWLAALTTGALGAWAFLALGQYRRDWLLAQQGFVSTYTSDTNLYELIFAYAPSPRYGGFALAVGDLAPQSTLVNSLMSPIPLLGSAFRTETGSALYNNAIYGNATSDQILPFPVELTWNFGPAGVILGFAVIGLALAWLDARWSRSRSLPMAFYLSLFGLWLGLLLIWSLTITVQYFLFFGVLPWTILRLSRRDSLTIAKKGGLGHESVHRWNGVQR